MRIFFLNMDSSYVKMVLCKVQLVFTICKIIRYPLLHVLVQFRVRCGLLKLCVQLISSVSEHSVLCVWEIYGLYGQ